MPPLHRDSPTSGPSRKRIRQQVDDVGTIRDVTRFEIAQLNVGRAVAPLEHAVMADFMNWLDEINALAERSPGFVWRLQGDNGNNTSLKVSDDPLFIVNLSVWAFTFKEHFPPPDAGGLELSAARA